ncbi:MAG: ribonuclease H-like domain-containing protein [Phycisphaerae bacterium]
MSDLAERLDRIKAATPPAPAPARRDEPAESSAGRQPASIETPAIAPSSAVNAAPAGSPSRSRTPPAAQSVAVALGGAEVTLRELRVWEIIVPFRGVAREHTYQLTPAGRVLHALLPTGEREPIHPTPGGAPAPGGCASDPPAFTLAPSEPGNRVLLRRALLVDIETGGLAGAPVFLIGVVRLDDDPPAVVQWLARDYREEQAILARFAALADERDVWLSFNGKSFDEPFLRDRATLHRVALARPRTHVDLLHLARRRWRGDFPDCRLETLEHRVLGRKRVGDVPGSDIPDLFHHFMKTGNARPLRPVLEHNRRDLVACAELLLRFGR